MWRTVRRCVVLLYVVLYQVLYGMYVWRGMYGWRGSRTEPKHQQIKRNKSCPSYTDILYNKQHIRWMEVWRSWYDHIWYLPPCCVHDVIGFAWWMTMNHLSIIEQAECAGLRNLHVPHPLELEVVVKLVKRLFSNALMGSRGALQNPTQLGSTWPANFYV